MTLEQLKEIHGEISTVTVTDKAGKTYSFHLKNPDRTTLQTCLGMLAPLNGGTPRTIDAGDLILKTCTVAGDTEALKNERVLIAASLQAVGVIEILDGELKKN